MPSMCFHVPQKPARVPALQRMQCMSSSAPTLSRLCGGGRLVVIGLDGGLEGLWVRAHNLGYLVAVLEEEEGRHSADAEFLRDVGHIVDIELVEARVGVAVGESSEAVVRSCLGALAEWRDSLDDLRRNDLAGPAPRSEAVENEERVLGLQGLLPVGLAARIVSHPFPAIMTSAVSHEAASSRDKRRGHSLQQVVYAFLAHRAGIGEKPGGEDGSVEGCRCD
jgi:hypothetical protein